MTREEFLRKINAEAASHHDLAEITDGVFADWLEAKIIRTPPQQGRARNWTETELQMALDVLRLKSLNVIILGEIRFHLWLDNPEIPVFKFDARGILKREFLPLRNQLINSIRSTYPDGQNTHPDGWPAKAVLRGMGELDSSLKPFIEYSHLELLDAYTLVRFGDTKGSFGQTVSRLFSSISKNLNGALFGKADAAITTAHINLLPSWISGLLSRSDEIENPIEKSIRLASDADFLLARRAFNGCTVIFKWLGLQRVIVSLRHPTWQTAMFVLFLHVIQRGWAKRLGITEQSIDFLEQNQGIIRGNSAI